MTNSKPEEDVDEQHRGIEAGPADQGGHGTPPDGLGIVPAAAPASAAVAAMSDVVQLSAGANTRTPAAAVTVSGIAVAIRATATTANGGPNVDYLELQP